MRKVTTRNKVKKSLSLAISVLMIASLASVMILTLPMASATHESSAEIAFTEVASHTAGGASSLDVTVTNSVGPGSIIKVEIDFTGTGFTVAETGQSAPSEWSVASAVDNVITYTATDGGIAPGANLKFVVLVTNPTTTETPTNPKVTTSDDTAAKATLTTGPGTEAEIVYTAVTAGDAGNEITIEYADPGIINQLLTVENDGLAIKVSLATNEAGALVSTASEVAAAINEDADAGALVVAASEGTGIVTESGPTSLTGGVDPGTVSSVPTGTLTIDPAAIDHYEVSEVSSPRTTKESFNVNIQAQDQYNNDITSGDDASEPINISLGKTDDGASWTSITTTGGEATVNDMTMTVAQKGQTIIFTGADSGKKGTSNAFDVVFADLTVGAVLEPGLTTTYTIGFTTGVTIPASGYMEIVLPEGYSLVESPTTFEATSTDTDYDETGNFTYSVNVAARTAKITLAVTGVSLTKESTVTVKLSDVTNPTAAGTSYAITINTKQSDGTLLETSAKKVTITGAGVATIDPDTPVVRGSTGTWTITYTVPTGGVVAGGGIEVTIPDGWTTPQTTDVTAAGYVTATVSGATSTVSVSGMIIKVTTDKAISSGTITVVYGDTSTSPNAVATAQTTAEADVEFKVALDRDANGVFADIATSPTLNVTAADGDGTATISPVDDVVAGSSDTWTIKYKVPAGGVAIDGGIKVTIPAEWTSPSGKVTAHAETDTGGTASATGSGQVITVIVANYDLVGGDNIIVEYGSATAQTTAETDIEFAVASDTNGDSLWTAIADSPTLNVIHSTLYDYDVDPSDGPYTAGVPFDVTITAFDEWDNPLGTDYEVAKGYEWTTIAGTAPDGINEPEIGYPLVSANFIKGVAVKTVTLYKAESDVKFTVTDSNGKSGESTLITVDSAAEIIDFETLVGSKTATIKFSGGVTTDLENALEIEDFAVTGNGSGVSSITSVSHIAGQDMAVVRFNVQVISIAGTIAADTSETGKIYDRFGNIALNSVSTTELRKMTCDRNVLSLEIGWNLISVPKLVDPGEFTGDIEIAYTYEYGHWMLLEGGWFEVFYIVEGNVYVIETDELIGYIEGNGIYFAETGDLWFDIVGSDIYIPGTEEKVGYIEGDIIYMYQPPVGIEPLNAYFVKANEPQEYIFEWTTDPQAVPTKFLVEGWNLVGPNMDVTAEPTPDTILAVETVLDSVATTWGGLEGWSTVFSPGYNLTSWACVSTLNDIGNVISNPECSMLTYEGYWVYMKGYAELAGRST